METNTGPSINFMKSVIKNKEKVEIHCIDSSAFTGIILWTDHEALCLEGAQGEKLIIKNRSVSWYKTL